MPEAGLTSESMLVKMENLNRLLQLAGDVIIASSNLEFTYKKLQHIYYKAQPLDSDILTQTRELTEITSSISSNLHHLVQAIRMVNLKDLIFRARRTVRETARKTNKRVNLVVEGEETTIDKVIAEALYDPIAHQLRNAVTHGIETVRRREALGKPPEGQVVLRARKTESEVFIEIEDDGAGVDMERLRAMALEMDLIGENDPFTPEDALDFMCRPGVSTAKDVSEVSGRGVGMDVVREDIEHLGGAIFLKTERNKGATMTFQLPLVSAVNILDTLVVGAGPHQFAFPINSVVATISLAKSKVHKNPDGRVIKYLDRFLPLYDLNLLLDPQSGLESERGNQLSIIIIEHKERIALIVDSFQDPQKLVVNPFDRVIQVQGLSGTTILGGKNLGLIIDVPSLINRAFGIKRDAGESPGFSTAKLKAGTDGAAGSGGPRKEFIIEVEKLAGGLNEVVFSLESEPDNADHMNRAFRLFHTTKGNLIMMGFPDSGKTIHAVESILDRARCGQIEVSAEVIDVLMDGISFIEELVRCSKSGTWEDRVSENIMKQSRALLPEEGGGAAIDVDATEIEPGSDGAFRAAMHQKRGTPVYHAHVTFDPGFQPPFLVGCLIYKRFAEAGDVLAVLPSLDDIEKGLISDSMKLILASDVDRGELSSGLEKLLSEHYGLTSLELTTY